MKYDEIISSDYRTLQALSDTEIYDVVSTVIQHYRSQSFPFFSIDEGKISKEFYSLVKSDWKKLEVGNNEIQQSMLGLATCNMFHPEMYSVRCNNSKSPMDIFLDDKLFRDALTKRIKYNDRVLNTSCVRRSLTAFGGQAVSNFRPTVARFLYKTYGNKSSKVLDPCAGYGGRLLGGLASYLEEYVGLDVNLTSIMGNQKLYDYVNSLVEIKTNVDLLCIPAEEYNPEENYFDMVVTSPPYFNTEKYSDEPDQSYIRYPTLQEWQHGFLAPMIDMSFRALKPGGYLILNVGSPIDEMAYLVGTCRFASQPHVWNMRLSKLLGQGNKQTIKFKLEPVYVWRKGF